MSSLADFAKMLRDGKLRVSMDELLDDPAPVTREEKEKVRAEEVARKLKSAGYVEVREFPPDWGPKTLFCGHWSWWWEDGACSACRSGVGCDRRQRERGAMIALVHEVRAAVSSGQMGDAQLIARRAEHLAAVSGMDDEFAGPAVMELIVAQMSENT